MVAVEVAELTTDVADLQADVVVEEEENQPMAQQTQREKELQILAAAEAAEVAHAELETAVLEL
jgi:hypothetical protein